MRDTQNCLENIENTEKSSFFEGWEYTDLLAFLKISQCYLPKEIALEIEAFAKKQYTPRGAEIISALLERESRESGDSCGVKDKSEEFLVVVLKDTREIVYGYLLNVVFPQKHSGIFRIRTILGEQRSIVLSEIEHFDLRHKRS